MSLTKKYPHVPIYLTVVCAFWTVTCMTLFGAWEGFKIAVPMLTAPTLYWLLTAILIVQKRRDR